ncbi:MAG TPA: phage protein Gp36 family protein [Polyangiales bacterium]|nr:phage protein Gp36 family protein [Polyangiales bacterium]
MADSLKAELLAGAERTLTGSGDSVDIGALRTAGRLSVTLGAVTGSPTAQVALETRGSLTAPWREVRREICGAQVQVFVISGLERYVRATWTAGAGITVFLVVSIDAHVLYCEPLDIARHALPLRATEGILADDITDACIAASTSAEDYIAGAYEMPLTAWPESVRMHVARLAGANLLRNRGIDPEGPDALVFDTERASVKWLTLISNGKLKPPGIVDSTPEEFEGGSVHVGGTSRGWGC